MLLMAFIVVNCAGTVVKNTTVAVKNTTYDVSVLPIREIRLVIYYGGYSQKQVHEAIDQVNVQLMKPENKIGIKLIIQEEKVTHWENRAPIGIMRQMDNELWHLEKVFDASGHWEWKHTGYNWDMAIAFLKPTQLEITKCDIISSVPLLGIFYNPCFVAGIDDSWRRYIVTKTLNVNVLLHEIACHGFIFHRAEGDTGEEPSICDVSALKLPIGPPLYGQAIFSERDKKEILENKWRVFGKKPVIPKKYSKDIL